jgi:16S rRNA processing protein RimM
VTDRSHGLLAVGQIVKAFGIRGEVIARSYADSPARFLSLSSVHVGPDEKRTREVRIERVNPEHRGIRLKLAGIDDRTAAEGMRGTFLFVDETQQVRLPEGRFFVHEVVGMTVLDENDRRIGRVREVLKLPAHDVYVIEEHGRESMIPAVKEFLVGIDPVAGVIRVRLIEGMVEE